MLILGMTMVSVNVSAEPQLPKLFVDPPTYTGSLLGEVFTIDINVSNIQALWGFEFKLGYNTTFLDALYAVQGPFPPPPASFGAIIYEQESYVLAYGDCGAGSVNGSGTMVTIAFNVTYEGSVSCTLDLYDTKLFDGVGENIDHQVEDGNYNFVIKGFTVATDKPTYILGENVEIYGNRTVGGQPYQWLVGLEVDFPDGNRMVVRTLETGSPPPGDITIIDLYPSNSWGQPKENFTRGYQAYFFLNVSNDGTVAKNITITFNAYDTDMVPLGVNSFGPWLTAPGTCVDSILGILIPEWASLGNATVYGSVFTDFPKKGGAPHCPEKSATFRIIDTNTTLGTTAMETQNSTTIESLTENSGNYSLTFKMPPEGAIGVVTGIYRVYATTLHSGTLAKRTALFGVDVIKVPDGYSTVQQAVNAATPTNNTILVMPGTYNEHVTINKSLTLVGIDPSTTIINGSGTGTVVTVTANNVEISKFTIRNGGSSPNSGITINNSAGTTLSENIITSNKGYGIYLNHSTSTTLKDNTMICNKYNFGVFGDSISDFTHNIDTSNTVDGKPIYYWVNQHGEEVPTYAGYVAIVSSTNIVVRDMELTKEGQGVLLAFTTDSLIERMKTLNNDYGIYLFNSNRNTIVGSQVSNNTVGIYQSYCSENIICHNNFISNTNQIDLYQSSNNTWDDSAGKGNHWSDYTGADDGSNNRTADDGVGDTLLPNQGVDWYPLMNPWILMHDIAITSVTPVLPYNATHMYPGWVITVTATLKNEGDFTETSLDITAYYDGNLIEPKTVSELTPQKEITINFTWNTMGVPYGNYTISATATPLPDETETTDNTYTDGWVLVTIPGDVDGSGFVDGGDQRKIQLAMFSTPGYPNWNPNADINGDNYVDGGDQKICQNHMFEYTS